MRKTAAPLSHAPNQRHYNLLTYLLSSDYSHHSILLMLILMITSCLNDCGGLDAMVVASEVGALIVDNSAGKHYL